MVINMNGNSSPNIMYEGMKKAANILSVLSKVLMILTIVGVVIVALMAMALMALPADFFEINTSTDVNMTMDNYGNFTEEDVSGGFGVPGMLGIDRSDFNAYLEEGKIHIDIKYGEYISLHEMGYMLIPDIIHSLVMTFLYYFAAAFFKSIAKRASQFGITVTGEEEGVFNREGLKALRAVFITYIISVFLPDIVRVFVSVGGGGFTLEQLMVIFVLWFLTRLYAYLVDLGEKKNSTGGTSGNPEIKW